MSYSYFEAVRYVSTYLTICSMYGKSSFRFSKRWDHGWRSETNSFYGWSGAGYNGHINIGRHQFIILDGQVLSIVLDKDKVKADTLKIETELDIELFNSILFACVETNDQDTFDKMYPKIAEHFDLEDLKILVD